MNKTKVNQINIGPMIILKHWFIVLLQN